MEDAFIIRGGKPLRGKVRLSGAKNVALKAIIAALLFDSKVTLKNVPRINDVIELLHLIRRLGAKAEFIEQNTLEIDGLSLSSNKVDLLHASKIRVSFMLFAPLLHRFKKCFIPNPGGCRIGARPISRVTNAMRSLGAKIVYNHKSGFYESSISQKPKGTCSFEKPSHTGTELLIMFSVFGSGTIIIKNAALEPEINELIQFLNQGGAQIQRRGSTIRIKGVSGLRQQQPFSIVQDANEAVTFGLLGIATKGDILLTNAPLHYLDSFLDKLDQTGNPMRKTITGQFRFVCKNSIKPVNIQTAPYPGFKTDWQSMWAVLMTQAQGEATIHERVFENRFTYSNQLKKLGAKIDYVEPVVKAPEKFYLFNYRPTRRYRQAIKIYGGHPLHGGVLRISDLRAGATLVSAALIAQGETIVTGASILERGYENFLEKVQNLGGDIRKI